MAGSSNCHRSKYGMPQTNRSVLRWFSLSEEPQESKAATATQRRLKKLHLQRKASKTKTKFSTRGVTNLKSEKRKGLKPQGEKEVKHAVITVNLISTKGMSSDEDLELTGGDIDGGEQEEDEESDDVDDEATSDFLTETSSSTTEEPILLPNIFIPCTKCGEVINICRLQGHRNLHSALQVLKYSHHQRPKDLVSLVRRRKLVIKQRQDASSLIDQHGFACKHLHKINTAFDVLRGELNRNMGIRTLYEQDIKEIRLNGLGLDMSCTKAAGVCEEANKRWKHMEDVHVYENNFLDNLDSVFLGIYDGYSGKNTALKCSGRLHIFLKEELDSIIRPNQSPPTKKQIAAAFRRSFRRTEESLLLSSEHERSQSRWSGCSAVTCVLSRNECYVANVGNVGALLLRDGNVAKVLTHKHDLYNKKERYRVKNSSGIIVKTERCALINGALGVTRGIGSIGDTALKKCVINEPNVKNVRLDPTDQLIIVASGGFWKVFSYEETIHLVNGFFGQIRMEAKQRIMGGRAQNRRPLKEKREDLTHKSSVQPQLLEVTDQGDYDCKFGVKTGYFVTNETGTRRWKSETSLDKLLLYHKANSDVSLLTKSQNDVEGEDVDETMPASDDDVLDDVTREYLRHHRFSLPDDRTIREMKSSGERELTEEEKARFLAKCLSERLVKCALYAESMDNLTVFVAFLPGFSMINWQMVTPNILEALDEFVEELS